MGRVHNMASSGNLKGIKKLIIENTEEMFERDDVMGWTALHYAAAKSKTKIVELILESGIDPNIPSTPKVNTKINEWNMELVEDKNNIDPIKYPMDVCEGENRVYIIKLFARYGGEFYGEENSIHQSIQLGDIDEVESFMEDESLRINARDRRGWMAIHYAVDFEHIDIIKLLLKNKATINGSTYNKKDIVHLNPYEIAYNNGNEGLLEFLKNNGAKSHPGRATNKHYTKESNKKLDFSDHDLMIANMQKEMREKDEEKRALKEPDTLLGKLFESKDKKEKREAVKNRIAAEKRKERLKKQEEENLLKEEESRKRTKIKKWGSHVKDPFELGGEQIIYDKPCQAHTYFMDIVGYSLKTTDEQKKVTDELIDFVKGTKSFQTAQRQGKLIILPTGDGMALVFFNKVNEAFKCMVDVGRMTHKHTRIGLRNGLYSGAVVPVKDINDNPNVSGAGINMAQRCMDAGDNDHLIISDEVYQYVNSMSIHGLKFDDWGQVKVKHGTTLHLWTAYGNNFGRNEFPTWRGNKRVD